MARRLADIIRNIAGSPVSGATVTVKKVLDNSTITSTTTGADGKAEFSETQIAYPGPLYYSATDGDTVRVHSGYSTGQIGTWFASDFPRAMRIMTDGVRSGVDGELNVTANGTNRTLTIANGLAFLYGHTYYQAGNLTVDIAANGAGNPRIDLVVVRLYPPGTTNEGKLELAVVAGSPSATPSAPTVTQDPATVWEIPLKTVLVDPGVSAIVSGKLTDARVYTSGPLQDLSVATAKLAANAVTPAKMSSVTDFSTAAAAKVLKASTSPTITPVYGTLNLSELNDVDETVPADGQIVTWDAASSKYKPKAPPALYVTVQEGDVTVDALANTLDFDANAFNVTSSPAGEANIAIAFGTASGTVAQGNHTHLLAGVTDVTATAAQVNFSTGVTSNIQTQLDAKVAGAASSTDGKTAVFNGTTGKIVKESTLTAGVVKSTAGVLSAAAASDLPTGIGAANIAGGTVSDTEFGYLDGVTSAIQTQLGTKFDKAGGTITGSTTINGVVSFSSSISVTSNANLGTGGSGVVHTFSPLWVGGADAFTVTAGSAAGTGGSLAASRLRGSDNAGEFQIVTGASGVGTGTLATISFAAALANTNYIVLFQPTSTAAGPLNFGLTARTTAGFDVRVATAPGAGATVQCAFLVVQVNAP